MYDETKLTKTPTVGLDATYRIGSDRYAGKIIAVSKTGHKFTWQRVYEAGTTENINVSTWTIEAPPAPQR